MGGGVTENTPLSQYPDIIRDIQTGVDTSDATAKEYHVIKDKIFYAGGERRIGSLESLSSSAYSMTTLFPVSPTYSGTLAWSSYSTTYKVLAAKDQTFNFVIDLRGLPIRVVKKSGNVYQCKHFSIWISIYSPNPQNTRMFRYVRGSSAYFYFDSLLFSQVCADGYSLKTTNSDFSTGQTGAATNEYWWKFKYAIEGDVDEQRNPSSLVLDDSDIYVDEYGFTRVKLSRLRLNRCRDTINASGTTIASNIADVLYTVGGPIHSNVFVSYE